MPTEVPLQHNMFSGEYDDNRTRRQKNQDRQRELPQQTEMFSQREIAQFGVNAHPLLPLSPNTRLILIPEDPRTEEEIERDTQKAAEELTYNLFADSRTPQEVNNTEAETVKRSLALVPRGVVAIVVYQQIARSLLVI